MVPRKVGDWIGGRFEIFDVHEGGMSLVYVVHDHMVQSGRSVVALKTLKDELLGHRIRRSRFATECRLWVQLGHHHNIVQAYAVEVLEGKPYVVMELVQGGDLVRWIGSPKLDLTQSLQFGVQFCQGMEHAVRQGLNCHRDVKPANLLITEDGVLKITDFGLARICEEMVAVRPELPDGSIPLAASSRSPQRIVFTDPRDQVVNPLNVTNLAPARAPRSAEQKVAGEVTSRLSEFPHAEAPPRSASVPSTSAAGNHLVGKAKRPPLLLRIGNETSENAPPPETAEPRLTRSGARLGTGAYMAPEQFRDPGSVDVRADIYAFGVVLFEMITGKLPFMGKSLDMLDRQHSRYDPPSVVPFIPRSYVRLANGVDQLVQRCLKKDPTERFRTVTELRKALRTLISQLRSR
jgi:serine/threonine protein kinase